MWMAGRLGRDNYCGKWRYRQEKICRRSGIFYVLSPHPMIKRKYVYRVLKSARDVQGRAGLMAVLVRSPGCFVLLGADTAMCMIDPGETLCTLIATLPARDEI